MSWTIDTVHSHVGFSVRHMSEKAVEAGWLGEEARDAGDVTSG
jgi:hypothetical protein